MNHSSNKKIDYIITSGIFCVMMAMIGLSGIATYLKYIFMGTSIVCLGIILVSIKTIRLEELKNKKVETSIFISLLFIACIFVFVQYILKITSTGTIPFMLLIDVFVLVCISMLCGMIIILTNSEKIEQAILIIVSSTGLVYMFTMPVSTVPDEIVHVFTAYHTSNVMMGIDDSSCEKTSTLMMRYDDTQYAMQALQYREEDIVNVLSQLTASIQNEELVQSGWDVMYGNEYLFLPCATGITIGRVFHLGTVSTLMLGRIFNFLFYLVMLYVSLKVLPVGKTLLGVIALLPMSLQQGMSYSYDVIVNACAFFLVAYSIYLIYSKREKKNIVLFIASLLFSVILFKAKSHAYAPIVALPYLVLLLKKWKKPEKKQFKMLFCIILGVLIIGFGVIGILMLINNDHLVPYVEKPLTYLDENSYTIPYLINHPKYILILAYNTLVHMSRYYISTCIGSLLGWLEININTIYIKIEFILLLLAALTSNTKQIAGSRKLVLFTMSMLSICFIIFGMIIGWTPIGSICAVGVQGRYFIPLLLPLLLILGFFDLKKVKSNWILLLQCCVTVCITFNMIAWFFR